MSSQLIWFIFGLILTTPSAWAQTWPRNEAQYLIDIQKTAGQEMTDPYWAHLMMPGQTVSLGVQITQNGGGNAIDLATVTVQVRYTVHGQAVSPWLSQPFAFTLGVDDASMITLDDGVHDISLEVQGAGFEQYRPRPMFLHLFRGSPHVLSPLVPVMSRDNTGYQKNGYDYGSGVVYVKFSDAVFKGYPVDPTVTPWTGPPMTADLYQEELSPHVDLFMATQMWWEQAAPPNQGEKFARGLVSKTSEELPVIWQEQLEMRRPYIDGPRGIAWIGNLTDGQVDSTGGLAFAEIGGAIRYLAANGDVTTVAGYRVKPDRKPIWWLKPPATVRQNMELRGTWTNGAYTDGSAVFHEPLDVAIDPKNDRIWYVAGYLDHCVWKIDVTTGFDAAQVSVFAGDVDHSSGFVDGIGTTARFNGVASLVFDPIADVLYVADQNNNAIRKITRAGAVTTLYRSASIQNDLTAKGVLFTAANQYTYQDAARLNSHYVVSAADALAGIRPDVYAPQTVRVDSLGRLLVNDVGFGAIRRIDLTTHQTIHVGNLYQHFIPNGTGWAWFDVDRWGHSGPKDGVYSCVFQGSRPDGELVGHPNEFYAWQPGDGSALGKFVFEDFEPNPDGLGPRDHTDPPHYCWMVAVDPRGALLMSGGGEHGVTRLRVRKPTDPMLSDYVAYGQAENLWNGKSFLGGTLQTGPPPGLKFGMLGRNYLGFANTWGLVGATDAALISAFELPPEITADPMKLNSTLAYLRFAEGLTSAPPPSSYALTVSVVGNGTVVCSPGSCGTPQPSGTVVALTEQPSAGFVFSGWSGACSGLTACVVTLTSPQAVTATFTAVPPPPDPCVMLPLKITGIKWPTGQTGNRSGSWNSGSFTLVKADFEWNPLRFIAVDARGCSITIQK